MYYCSTCGIELTPYIQTPCPKSESGLHSISDEDFKRQTSTPTDAEMLDWLEQKMAAVECTLDDLWVVTVQGISERGVTFKRRGDTLREAIRNAMKADQTP